VIAHGRKLRLTLWFTLISAVIGGFYSHFHAVMDGSPLFTFDGVPRGVLTAFVIAGVLTSLEVFVMTESLGAPLRRASFPVHVAVKTIIYLIVILLALEIGASVFAACKDVLKGREKVPFATILLCVTVR
jgi:hypothetical protein